MLDRIAQETGGRLTRNTNDLSLAYARAQRDQGCRYTLGFYLPTSEEDTPRRIRVHLLRDGLHALTPTQYMARSKSEQRVNEISAAFFAPDMFDTGYLRAHVFPLQPRGKKKWNTLIAVSFPVQLDNAVPELVIDFGAVVENDAKTVHRFDRRATLKLARGAATKERRFMFLEPTDLAPGEYRLTVVMKNTDETRPDATRLTVEVPPIPRKSVMLVEPILGRPRDENVVVRGTDAGSANRSSDWLAQKDIVAAKGSFEPTLVQLLDDGDEIHARNKACIVGATQQPGSTTVERQVTEDVGESWRLPSVPLTLKSEGPIQRKVLCQNLYEVVPNNVMDPGGEYEFSALVEAALKIPEVNEQISFAVVDGEGQ